MNTEFQSDSKYMKYDGCSAAYSEIILNAVTIFKSEACPVVLTPPNVSESMTYITITSLQNGNHVFLT